MTAPACVLCAGTTTRCELVGITSNSQPTTPRCWGMEKTGFFELTIQPRRHYSEVAQWVCVDCGYIMTFTTTPGVFRAELGEDEAATAKLPIPSNMAADEREEG
jgi:hypothetical protein